MNKLLNVLPKGTIDAVLQGHYHNIAHHYINSKFWINSDIPVAGNVMGAKYFNILYL